MAGSQRKSFNQTVLFMTDGKKDLLRMEHTIFLFIKTRILLLFLPIAIMHMPIHSLIPLSMSEIIATLSKKQMKINI